MNSDLAKSLAIGRLAIGTVALLLPKLTARLFLLNAGRNPQLPYMTRLFAAREIALGAVSLAAPEDARTQLLGVGIAVDGSDAVAGLAAARSGIVSKPAGAMLTVAALGAVVAGAAAIAGRR
jgi:hypothetical protein